MVFSSNVFLFLFLPAFLICYYLTPGRSRNVTILIGSYLFYAWWRVDFLLLFVAVTLWNYLFGIYISKRLSEGLKPKRLLAIGITGNLATLGYFKYANFGVESINAILSTLGFSEFDLLYVLLPIGISFYIFQAISYIIDVYRGDVEATRHPLDFAAFIALFPQLIAGPVIRYKDIAHQFSHRTHTVDKFSEGVRRFMMGFIKKVMIADSIAPLADNAFALENPSAADAWIGAIAYTAQLYFDFSGYSDMAIGLGLMMGFRFMENFNQPYISQSITEFWRRWHISLSSWLRDYLYIPLGGNRHGTLKTYRNLFLTMLLGGLWHGANWTFVIWGAWHGIWLAIEKAMKWGTSGTLFSPAKWLFTFILVMIGWVMFRAESVDIAFRFYDAMLFGQWRLSESYAASIDSLQVTLLVVAYTVILLAGFKPRIRMPQTGQANIRMAVAHSCVLGLFSLSLLKLSAQSYSPFLYFQF